MIRPTLEVADIIRAQGERFLERSRSWLTWPQRKALRAIERCRTDALGGHRDRCIRCGYRAISYNSCRNRHCPKCQTGARNRWLAERSQEVLPVRYVHVVFTLPHQLAPLAYQNKRLLYRLLFQASAATLLEVAADPQHLGAEIGFLSVLHTWGQNLLHHLHVHCVIPAGGLSPDHSRWIHPRYSFFLPVKVLRRVFRGRDDKLHDLFVENYAGHLASVRNHCEELGLEAALVRCDRFVQYLKGVTGSITVGGAADQARVLREAIEGDLHYRRFAFVPADKSKVLDAINKDWAFVWNRYPAVKTDSIEAVECYALGRNAASIFHAMRVAERGLRILAQPLKLPLKKHIEYSNWGDILRELNKKLAGC